MRRFSTPAMLGNAPEALPHIPSVGLLEIPFKPWIGFRRKDILVLPKAGQRSQGRYRHVGQLNPFGFVVLSLPDIKARVAVVEFDVRPLSPENFALSHPRSSSQDEERLQLGIALLVADANHRYDLLRFGEAVPPGGFLLLRNYRHRILVIFLEPDCVVKDAAEDCAALVDARCREALFPEVAEEISHGIRRDFARLLFPNRSITLGVRYSNLLRVRLPWFFHHSLNRSMKSTVSNRSAANRFFMATSVRAWASINSAARTSV